MSIVVVLPAPLDGRATVELRANLRLMRAPRARPEGLGQSTRHDGVVDVSLRGISHGVSDLIAGITK